MTGGNPARSVSPLRRWTIAVALALLLPSAASAQTQPDADDHSVLRVCADPSGLPFSNDKGEGFENRIATLFAEKLGVPLRYTWYPNAVGFLRNTLRARQCDLVMGIVVGADLVLN